jgi:hypothetical protein
MGKKTTKKTAIQGPQQPDRSLLQIIIGALIAQVVGFLFGTALIGASTYLLLQYQSDRIALERDILEYSTLTSEFELGARMADVFNKHALDLDRLDGIIIHLSHSVRSDALDSKFVDESREWIIDSISKLDEAEGIIGGSTFNTKLLADSQRDCLQIYSAERGLLEEARTAIDSWGRESEAQRREHFASIESLVRKDRVAVRQMTTRIPQALDLAEAKMKENKIRYEALLDRNKIITRKASLSLAGIPLGLLLMAGAVCAFLITKRNSGKRNTK